MRTERVTVRLPAGIADGERVRVAGKGDAGPRGGPPATSTSRSTWRPIPTSGATATTCTWWCRWRCTRRRSARASKSPALDGPVRVRIPPGTQSGQRFRIRERGMASTRGGPRGDLVVEARLMLPTVLDERSQGAAARVRRDQRRQVRPRRDAGGAADEQAGPRRADVRGGVGAGELTMAKKTERGKAYFMISAVSQKYDIHPQTLRLYEREGLLTPSRTEGNTRLYSEEDLEQLETILSLTRDLGVNLAGVEIILNMRRKIERMQGEVNEFMDYVKRELARGIDDWEQRLSTAMVKSGADRSCVRQRARSDDAGRRAPQSRRRRSARARAQAGRSRRECLQA